MKIEPISTLRNTSNELSKLTEGENTWLLKRYQGKDSLSHRENEEARLRAWLAGGYPVPEIADLNLPSEQQPYLVIQWLEGESLGEFLTSDEIPDPEKLERLQRIIAQFHSRHKYVQQHQDLAFIHHDPNTGNIFLTQDSDYYIDFEEIVSQGSKSITDLKAIELAKLIRWSARDMGRENLPDILRLTVEIYGEDSEIIATLIDRVYRQPLQFFQRYKDRRKKIANVHEITKYDLADGFTRVLEDSA